MKNITTMNLIEILKTISKENPFDDTVDAQMNRNRWIFDEWVRWEYTQATGKSIQEKVSELQKAIALELVRRGVSPMALS